jgi:PAS domain S-box-containing protein
MTTIADASPTMIACWDKNLLCRYANVAYFEWFNKEPSDVIGCSLRNVLGEPLFSMKYPYIVRALSGSRQSFERILTKSDGTIGHMLAEYIPNFDKSGNVSGFFALCTDITNMKQIELKLRDSEARYRLLADNSADMVFQLDRNFVCNYASPASLEILGIPPDELIGLNGEPCASRRRRTCRSILSIRTRRPRAARLGD